MRLTRACLASLLLPAAAAAQPSVSVFGIVDAGLLHGSGSIASRTQLASGGADFSRLGFSGVEDLGGGWRAVFWLEGDILIDTGTGSRSNLDNQAVPNLIAANGTQGFTFNRLVYVGLQGPWGRFRTGRDYTPSFAVQALYDPGGAGGLLGTQSAYGSLTVGGHPAGVRASNSLAVAFGELRDGPLLHMSYALGENSSNAGLTRHDGGYRGVRIAYTKPEIDVALGYGLYKLAAVDDIRELVLGAKFTVHDWSLWLQHLRNRTGSADRMHGSMAGLTHSRGPWQFRGSVSHSARQNHAGTPIGTTVKGAVGVLYSMSPRTTLYADVARTRNSHGASQMPAGGIGQTAPNKGGTGQDVGVRHSF